MCGSLVSNISTSIKNCIRSVAALKMAFNRTTIRNLGVGQKFHNVRLAQTFDTLQACFLTSDCRWMAESMVAASLIPRPRIQQHAQYVCKTYEHVMFDIIEPHAFRKYSTCWVLENLKSLTCRIPLRGCFFCGGELSRQICVNTSPRQTCFVCRIFHKKKHLVGLESMTKFSLPGQNWVMRETGQRSAKSLIFTFLSNFSPIKL